MPRSFKGRAFEQLLRLINFILFINTSKRLKLGLGFLRVKSGKKERKKTNLENRLVSPILVQLQIYQTLVGLPSFARDFIVSSISLSLPFISPKPNLTLNMLAS
jgi:hypothetical protein